MAILFKMEDIEVMVIAKQLLDDQNLTYEADTSILNEDIGTPWYNLIVNIETNEDFESILDVLDDMEFLHEGKQRASDMLMTEAFKFNKYHDKTGKFVGCAGMAKGGSKVVHGKKKMMANGTKIGKDGKCTVLFKRPYNDGWKSDECGRAARKKGFDRQCYSGKVVHGSMKKLKKKLSGIKKSTRK